MDKFKQLTNKKILGVPVIFIVLVVAAGVLYLAIRTPATPDVPAEDEEGDTEGDIPDPVTQQPVFVVPSSQAAPLAPVENTNDLWARKAVEWLISQGIDPSVATSAITKYVNSETLSYEEGQARDMAVKQFGLPPEGLSTSNTLGYRGPASKQGTPPTNHVVRGKSDNSFGELARLYYGSENADYVTQLRTRNRYLSEPLKPGQTVRIPEARNPRYYRATGSTRSLYAIAKKNSVAPAKIENLNPGMSFPVKVGTRVRVA